MLEPSRPTYISTDGHTTRLTRDCRERAYNLTSSCEESDIFDRFHPNLDFLETSTYVPYIKFHENPSSGSRADTRGRTVITKLPGAFGDLGERA